MHKKETINMAKDLRKKGKSLNEIVKEVGVSKTTIYNWIKDLDVTIPKKAPKKTEIDCGFCKKKFNKQNYLIGNSKCGKDFCSQSCSIKYHNSQRPKRKRKNKCKLCETLILSKVSYCSECWDLTKKNKKIPNSTDCVCEICKREYKYNRSKGGTLNKCNSCITNIRRFKRKEKCVEYKGGKCSVCEYDKCNRVLSFHHKDPTTKLFTISGNHCRSWEEVKSELDKCDLLCSNCHIELHDKIENMDITKLL